MSLFSLGFNRTVGRPILYPKIGNKIADVLDSDDKERAAIVKITSAICSIGLALVTLDPVGGLDAVGSATDMVDTAGSADVATTADHISSATDVQFGSDYHDEWGNPITPSGPDGISHDPEGFTVKWVPGTYQYRH
jgi:hypothetical protein